MSAATDDGEATDPRVEAFKRFLAAHDAWKADPDDPDTPNATEMAILRDDMLTETIGAIGDDPVVAQFRSLIPLAKAFLTKQDKPGTHAKAIHLVDSAFDLFCQVGVRTAAQHIFYAAVRNAVGADMDKPPWDLPAEQYTAAGAAGLLRGEAALHELITSRLLPSDLGPQMALDARVQSGGDESLFGRKVEGRRRQNKLGTLLDNVRSESVLRAHYEAGREGCGWKTAHQRLFAGVAATETLNDWNKRADSELRTLARSAGEKAGRQVQLNAREQAIEDCILRRPVEDIARDLRNLTKK